MCEPDRVYDRSQQEILRIGGRMVPEAGIYHGDQDHYAGEENIDRSQRRRQGGDRTESFLRPHYTQVPASVLQLHNDVTLVADEAALSKLSE